MKCQGWLGFLNPSQFFIILLVGFLFIFYRCICGGSSVFHRSSINLFLCSDSYWTEILSRYWTKYMVAPYKHYPRRCWWWWQADMSKYPVSREVLISQRSFGSRVRPFIFIGSPEGRQYPSLYLTTSSISLPNWRPPNPPVDNKQQPQIPSKSLMLTKPEIEDEKMKNPAEMSFRKCENLCGLQRLPTKSLFSRFFPTFPDEPTWGCISI